MSWFIVRAHGVTYDGRESFPLGSYAYSEGESVEERARVWGLQKPDLYEGLPDLFYQERLTRQIMADRNCENVETNGWTIELIEGQPPEGAFICGDFLLCVYTEGLPKR